MPASYVKWCSLVNLGYCAASLKEIGAAFSYESSDQITGSSCKAQREIHKYMLFVSLSTESAVFWQLSPPICAFKLNLTETIDEFCNRHCWNLSPRKAFWIG